MRKPVALRLDTETWMRLDQLAQNTKRGHSALVAEAVEQFLELNEWQIKAISQGAQQADAGQFIDHAKLKMKWDKKLAAAMDKAR